LSVGTDQTPPTQDGFPCWYVDSRGRCVCIPTSFWIDTLNEGLPEDKKFVPVQIHYTNPLGIRSKTLVHRPSGGLGDLICIHSAVESYMLQHPDVEITLAISTDYHWLFKHLKTNIQLLEYQKFHSVGFNTARKSFKEQFFLWCPAGMHEWRSHYKPTKGRVRNFAEALQVIPKTPLVCLSTPSTKLRTHLFAKKIGLLCQIVLTLTTFYLIDRGKSLLSSAPTL